MLNNCYPQSSFWSKRRVLVTGHTGFKGAWLCRTLLEFGADVSGYALAPDSQQNIFTLSGLDSEMDSVFGDIRDVSLLKQTILNQEPEIVIHMAAQALVGVGYKNPQYTYETNVMGTVNVLEGVRETASVKSFLNITTDKVYYNTENPDKRYREEDRLDGFDPYSNSKSCSELVTATYARSFFKSREIAISTARSGNVIGGGDFSLNRIIPDCVRAFISERSIQVRNPCSTRPYQHVLEPISAYLEICKAQYCDQRKAGFYNVGPDKKDCLKTSELVDLFCAYWGEGCRWNAGAANGFHEANYLALDSSKIFESINWRPRWGAHDAIKKTVEGYKAIIQSDDFKGKMNSQIEEYFTKES